MWVPVGITHYSKEFDKSSKLLFEGSYQFMAPVAPAPNKQSSAQCSGCPCLSRCLGGNLPRDFSPNAPLGALKSHWFFSLYSFSCRKDEDDALGALYMSELIPEDRFIVLYHIGEQIQNETGLYVKK